MIKLEKHSTEAITQLYSLINTDREYYSALPWANSCTQELLLDFFEIKKTTSDITYLIYNDDIPVGVIDGRVKNTAIDIGYWIGKSYANKGYTTEAVKLFLSNLEYKEITASALNTNTGSRRVLEKCGFILYHSNEKYSYYRISTLNIDSVVDDQ